MTWLTHYNVSRFGEQRKILFYELNESVSFVKLWGTSGLTWVCFAAVRAGVTQAPLRVTPSGCEVLGSRTECQPHQAAAECCSHNVSLTLFRFSSMKRLKTALWSIKTGERLSSLAILHTHKNKDVEIDSVVTEFALDGVTVSANTVSRR